MSAPRTGPLARPRSRIPAIAGGVALALGLVNLTAVLGGSWRGPFVRLLGTVPGVLVNVQTISAAIAGVLLIVLASGLSRRKRRAWLLALVLVAVSLAVYLLTADRSSLLALLHRPISLALLLLLIVGRREFVATTSGIPRLRAAVSFAILLALGTGWGLVLLVAGGGQVVSTFPFPSRLAMVWLGFVGAPNPVDSGDSRAADTIFYGLLGTGVALAVCLLFLALRTARPRPHLNSTEAAAVRRLLSSTPSPDSLGYFALRADSAVLLSETRHVGIPYCVVDGVMLATGDPLGDEDLWPAEMRNFVAVARDRAWIPAVASCSDRSREIWRHATGMRSFGLGGEAITDPSTFCLDGRRMRNVRQMVHRTRRSGVDITVRRVAELSDEERAELARLAGEWRHGRLEKGHTMALGRVGDPRDGDCFVAVARASGAIQAFACFVPWGRDGLSLDLMRRHPRSAPGLTETIIVSIIERADELQIRRLSLNFVAFQQALVAGLDPDASVGDRVRRWLLLRASRWVQIDSLYRFNLKFNPTWQPRFVLYQTRRDLPLILLGLARAEGLIPGRPYPSRRRTPAPSLAR